ncbi:hypothetical protein EDC65_0391 [Stella humosa]|uniref:Uncharacterized protein n=1 Tax=Stella humosa TaxID=94 RepID=A0A3N1MBW0_9PROT|nr:hypothetical protein [Stella humosa]ROQ01213.1 hypothetical protein EDC65_0391 [Stella humosa]BBK31587.1 hypothetical protein STHU_22210 [Stella humosa]
MSPILKRGAFAASMLLAMLPATSGSAGELPAVGEVHRATLVLLGRSVPLPPGDWTVIGQGHGPVAGPSPGAYGAIGGVMLVQQRGGIVEGIVLAHANLLPVENGWGPASECNRVGAVYATGVRQRARNLACAYVVMSPASGGTVAHLPAWASGRAEASRRAWQIPGALAIAGVRVSDRRDAVDVRYVWPAASTPERATQPMVQRAATATEPGSMRLRARALAPWVGRALDEIEGRLEDPLGPTATLSWPGAPPPAADPPAGTSRWQRRLGQAVTSRGIQASLTMGVGFIVTGNVYTAGLLAAWHSLTDGVGSHLVEFGWEWEGARPAMDFVADGVRAAG